MSYSNFTKVSAEEGYAVGAQAGERKVISSSGVIYLPKVTNAGVVLYSSVTSADTVKATFDKAVQTQTITKKYTLTKPMQFYKVKVKGACANSAAITASAKLNGVKVTSSKTATGKSTTCTSTNTKPQAGTGSAQYFTARAKIKLAVGLTGTNTAKGTLSVATLSVNDLLAYTIPKIA